MERLNGDSNEAIQEKSFNVAMTIQSWKGRAYQKLRMHLTRFNVAMTIQSWKGETLLGGWAEMARLQCGHDHSVMERR